MFWHASVLPSICLSTGGVPISHNALQHFPECHGADTGGGYPARGGGTLPGPACQGGCTLPGPAGGGTLPGPAGGRGGVPCQVQPWGGTLPGPARGVPCWGEGEEVPWSGTPPARSGFGLRGGTLVRYPPSQVRTGGLPCWKIGGTGGRYPGQVPPWPGQDRALDIWGGISTLVRYSPPQPGQDRLVVGGGVPR